MTPASEIDDSTLIYTGCGGGPKLKGQEGASDVRLRARRDGVSSGREGP